MADKDNKKDPKPAPSAKPGFDPKPVQLGGESLLERLIPHMKKIVYTLVAGAAILTVIFAFRCRTEQKREKQTAGLATVLEVADRDVRAAGTEPDPKAKDPTFATNKERAEAVLAAMAKANAPGTYRASMLLQAGKVDEAIAEYRKHQNGKTIDAVLAREGLGVALEAKAHAEKDAAARQKLLEEALTVYQQMQPDPAGSRHGYALYHQGRILMSLGKTAEAKAAFEKAKDIGKDSRLTSLIEERLASIGAS